MIGLRWQAGGNAIGACDSSVWVRVVLSPRWGLSVSHFPHGLRGCGKSPKRASDVLKERGFKPRLISFLKTYGTAKPCPFKTRPRLAPKTRVSRD